MPAVGRLWPSGDDDDEDGDDDAGDGDGDDDDDDDDDAGDGNGVDKWADDDDHSKNTIMMFFCSESIHIRYTTSSKCIKQMPKSKRNKKCKEKMQTRSEN